MTTETGTFPASPMIEALWWIHYRAKNKSVYNLTWPMTCDRPLDLAALRVAWQAVVDRHDALRASLHQHEGKVFVSIADHIDVEPQWIRIEDPGSAPADTLARSIAEEVHERPIALDKAPVARLVSVTIGDQHELILTIHHSLVDGWGVQLVMDDLAKAYGDAAAGRTPTFEGEPVSLREHILDAHAARSDGRWDASMRYWRDRLDGATTTTVIADRHRYTGTGNKGEVLRYALSREAVDGAARVGAQYSATPFTVVLAALQTVLAHGGAGPDVCTGVVTANRRSKQEQAMVGYVANLILARNTINEDDSFATVVERTRDMMWGMLAHSAVPFSNVFGGLTPEAQTRLRDAIPVIMTYYGPIGSGLRLGEVDMQLRVAPNRAARTDIGIGVWDSDTGFVFESEHNSGRYDRETVLRLFYDIDATLAAFGADPSAQVSTLDTRTKTGPAFVEHEVTVEDLGTTMMPQSAALDQVRHVWTEVLGTEPAGPDEDFFATGGRSLKVVQFASSIESETGVPLDVVHWLTEPTPRRAAEQIAGELDASGTESTLVGMREGTGPHVHLIPGSGGSAQDYRDLLAELPADWRITLSQEREPLASVPEMARRYRADLDAAGLRPDLLVGWSMGGQIAFEMASGYPDGAPSVALLDATPPIGYARDQATEDFMYNSFVAGMATALGASVDGTPARTTPGDPELAMRVLAARLTTASGQQVSAAMLIDRWATFSRHSLAVTSYVTQHQLRAPGLVVGAGLLDRQLDQWGERFASAPRVLRVAANHYGVLRQPVIDEVARAIAELHSTAASPA